MFEVNLRGAISRRARYIALWWDALAVPERNQADFNLLLKGLPEEPGIYAVSGRRDASVGPCVLYVGKATNLSKRTVSSFRKTLSETHFGGQQIVTADVWDLTIHWARLRKDLHTPVERLLIMSHSPPFNSQVVRRSTPRKDELDLIVMSAGRKGPLLPIVAGAYQSVWKNKNGKQLGP